MRGAAIGTGRGPAPKVVQSLSDLAGHDEVLLTGGEPLLFPGKVVYLIGRLKDISPTTKVYVYTAAVEDSDAIARVLKVADGMCVTLHTQKDAELFRPMLRWGTLGTSLGKSMRLNVFKGVSLGEETKGWKCRSDMEWIKDCSLPEGEELFRLEDPWVGSS